MCFCLNTCYSLPLFKGQPLHKVGGLMLKDLSTLVTPLKHNGSETQTNPDRVAQVSKEVPKSLTLYIPENFDLDSLLENNPPNFKYHRECFLYVIHLISDIPTRRKDIEYDYVPLYSPLLKRRLGNNYRKYLDYLVLNGVLLENSQYMPGKYSRSFMFHTHYQQKVKPVLIHKYTLIKSILKFIDFEYNIDDDSSNFIEDEEPLECLFKWYNSNLTIDYKEAIRWLDNEFEKDERNFLVNDPIRRYNKRFIPVSKFHRGQFTPTLDTTAGRLHSSLTQLKKELRQFIKYDNQTLVSIDIKNSQPYLSTVLLDINKINQNEIGKRLQAYNPKYKESSKSYLSFLYYVSKIGNPKTKPKDVGNYIDLVSSGVFYEEFANMLDKRGLIKDELFLTNESSRREYAKRVTFRTLFSPNRHKIFSEEIKTFNQVFPNVSKVFEFVKSGYKNHNALSCLLQNFEAKLVLHTACKEISLMFPEAPIFTLHDSIITTERYQNEVQNILNNVLFEYVGLTPSLSIEIWERAEAA